MSKRTKNVIAVVAFLAVILGVNGFFFYNWLISRPRSREEVYDTFCARMDKKYGGEDTKASVRMEDNDKVMVLVAREKDGDEAYYEIFKTNERNPGSDKWSGPTGKGTIHKGDQIVKISQKVRDQPSQWVYIIFWDEAAEVQVIDDGEIRTVKVKAGVPTPVTTETPPEEIRILPVQEMAVPET